MIDLVFKLIVGGVFMYALYVFMFKKDIFSLGKSFNSYLRNKRRRHKVKQLSYLMERSNSVEEIEDFILANVGFLSEDIILRMASRIDYLQALDIINEDDKFRVNPIHNGTTMKERTGKSFNECCIEASEEMKVSNEKV